MANQKQCNECGKVKELTEFHKKTASKDGKQAKCKACMKVKNKNFREENPKYQVDWQRKNSADWNKYTWAYRKADKNSLIYKITAPDGKCYIGQTKSKLFVRFTAHKHHYRKKNGIIPGLHKSFDQWGIENHKVEVILDLGDLDRNLLTQIESSIIDAYKQKGLSLNIKN